MIPLLPPPLPEARLQRCGRWHLIAPALTTSVLEVHPWVSLWPLGWSTPLEVEVGYVWPKGRASSPPPCTGG